MKPVGFFILLAGCAPPLQQELLIIDELEVTGVSDFSKLDLEVHLYELIDEEGTERYLGCAGEGSGLEDVDLSDVRFDLEAFFVTSNGTQPLEAEDLTAERFRLVVIEDDEMPCPVEQNATDGPVIDRQDDLVGKSSAIDRGDLRWRVSLSFDDVVRISTATKIDG
jgi:hypothetical protein